MQYYGKTPVENTRDAVIESTVIKKKRESRDFPKSRWDDRGMSETLINVLSSSHLFFETFI